MSVIYIFNTYYLLLVDGGVVGVVVAYGIFPVSLFFLKRFSDRLGYSDFWKAMLAWELLTIFDPRISAICFGALILWKILEGNLKSKQIMGLLFLGVSIFMINAYWLWPLYVFRD